MVDVESQSYEVALEYMIRLRTADFDDPRELARLSGAAGMEPQAFYRQFSRAAVARRHAAIHPVSCPE